MEAATTEALEGFKIVYPTTKEQKIAWGVFLRDLARMIPVAKPDMSISKHAEDNRVMPPGERYPGPLNLDRSPHVREIMDNMSPDSGVRDTYVMKGAQAAMTMAIECIINFYIGQCPADQLLATATADLYRRWTGRRLEPAIDSYEYRDKIFAQAKRKSGKESGDKIASKEYIGGQLDLVSFLSAASLRAMTKRIVVVDEADGGKEMLDTGEGSYMDVLFARTKAWGDLAKRLVVSTPTVSGQSIIERLHAEGDQRRWFVPCPNCKKKQVMVWPGFKWDFKDRMLDSVWYECEFCEKPIYEHQKLYFLPLGEWRPTAKPKKRMTRSYHFPSWYAPFGFSPWLDIVESYLKAQGNASRLRSFVNLEIGLAFRDRGARPKLKKVLALQGTYKAGTVPDGVLFLTAAVDVQRGSLNDPNNPPRLEMEICGHGIGYRTWSIIYKRFEGPVKDAYSGAWAKLTEYGNETELTFERKDGTKFPVEMMFVDSGDGTMSDVVYRFTEGLRDTYPISGFGGKGLQRRKYEESDEKDPKSEKGDEVTTANLKRFRVAKSGDVLVIQISTNHYKTNLYNSLNVKRLEEDDQRFNGVQRSGFCDFPGIEHSPLSDDYNEKFFNMLRAEDKMKDDSFKDRGRRNEALDCRVYNLCAAAFFLQRLVDKLRELYKKDYKPEELRYRINIFYALEYLAKRAGVDYDRYAGITNSQRKAG